MFLLIFFLSFLSVQEIRSFGKPPVKIMNVKVIPQTNITKVHLIFMNHLDVGYSDHMVGINGFSANVINTYFTLHFPTAINLARKMKSDGYVEQFRYTTHPWLLHLFLHCPKNLTLAKILIQCPNPTSLNSMRQAIKDGDMIWHAGPMNLNYENLNAFGLNVALNISANLDKEFGFKKPIRVISLRDVPGLSRGVLRQLLKNNIVGISSGVNSGSAPPNVPRLSRWRAAPRSNHETNIPEIIYMQNPDGYPNSPGPNPNNPGGISINECHQAPGSTETLCFMFRSDNMGPPQSEQEVLSAYEILRAQYINAKLVASTFEDFFTILWKNKALLPVVDKEMGDTWIQGGSSDPKKFARFRAMQREFEYYYKSGLPIGPEVVDASRFMVKPSEHTYGLENCWDTVNWSNDQFSKIRNNPGMVAEELSWVEQRQFQTLVLNILGPNHILTKSILKAFAELESVSELLDEKDELIFESKESDEPHSTRSFQFVCSNGTDSIIVGFQNEMISYLLANDILITPKSPLGKLVYNTYNESDTDFWLKYYKTTWNTGYGKPNSTINAHPESKNWDMKLRSVYKKSNSPCSFMITIIPSNSSATSYYGFPERVLVLWDINITSNEISTEVYLHRKKPTRLMEAISFSFNPQFSNNNYQWYFSKIGEPISPYSVMLNGSQWQHTVDDSGVFIAKAPDASPIFQVIPWDTGITCPITASYGPTVWPAPLYPITDYLTGVAFNFYNNVWNTNFIYWYPYNGEDTENDAQFKARFTTKLSLITKKNYENL